MYRKTRRIVENVTRVDGMTFREWCDKIASLGDGRVTGETLETGDSRVYRIQTPERETGITILNAFRTGVDPGTAFRNLIVI